jgi:hypothetical protein
MHSFCITALLVSSGAADSPAKEVKPFRVYEWSEPGNPDPDTRSNCRAIDRTKKEEGWATPRREVANVSNLDLPDDQEPGTAYRIFVDYCVRLDGSKERPVGSMTFRAAPHDDASNIKRWGVRHYKATAKVRAKVPKPVREHFDQPQFGR